MKDVKETFDVLASVERHIEALKPLLPKQALVCIGEYPIKTLLKETGIRKQGTLPILIEKSSDEIYKWLPKGYPVHFVLGFEDTKIDTHFWYNVLPTIAKDDSVIESLKKKNVEKLHSAIIFCFDLGWSWQRYLTNVDRQVQSLNHRFPLNSSLALENTALRRSLQRLCSVTIMFSYRWCNSFVNG